MRSVLFPVVLCSLVLLFNVDVALAKKGGGGHGTRGPSKSSRAIVQPKQRTHSVQTPNIRRTSTDPLDRRSIGNPSSLRPGQTRLDLVNKTDPRISNEERKLQHQLNVAQQLRDIANRNGNVNLLQTADRMEQMAISRYQQFPSSGVPALSDLNPPSVTPMLPGVNSAP